MITCVKKAEQCSKSKTSMSVFLIVDEMYADRVTCCPLVSCSEYADRDGQTNGYMMPVYYITLSARFDQQWRRHDLVPGGANKLLGVHMR